MPHYVGLDTEHRGMFGLCYLTKVTKQFLNLDHVLFYESADRLKVN